VEGVDGIPFNLPIQGMFGCAPKGELGGSRVYYKDDRAAFQWKLLVDEGVLFQDIAEKYGWHVEYWQRLYRPRELYLQRPESHAFGY
jgi:hypothetical protein